ncbi:MAG: right-handed parallel beta-helix repeat-containing protein [Eudoraea sp.]|uniref:right-handed parallel beta-helix repeat-containing protein n=1 Tax=Eudoraea sp. TaxID=1979955 RepID=UPI0032658641
MNNGGTLYLGPGTFKIHGTIGRQNLSNPTHPSFSRALFNGTIQGAGKGVTILKGVRGPEGVSFEPLQIKEKSWLIDYADLLMFAQEYLGVKDLTFESELDLVDRDPYFHPGGVSGLYAYIEAGSQEYGLNELVGTDIKNVHFKGVLNHHGDWQSPPDTDMRYLFVQNGDGGGIHNITGCDFENSVYGSAFLNLADPIINIGGSQAEKVTFTNIYLRTYRNPFARLYYTSGVAVAGCGSTTLNVSHIETNESTGIYFRAQENTVSNVKLTNSVINLKGYNPPWYAGVELWGSNSMVSAVISDNSFHYNEVGNYWTWGPIFTDGVETAVINNNTITGKGAAPIKLNAFGWNPGSMTLIQNHLAGWEIVPDPWGLGTARIWLGPFVVNSLVVGGNNHTNIFDEPAYDLNHNPLSDEDGNPLTVPGYGELIPPEEFANLVPKNNIFNGVNNIRLNIGKDVRDAMRQEVETREEMMNRTKRQ